MKSQHNIYYIAMSTSFIRKVWDLLGSFAIHGLFCRGFFWWASSFFNAFWAFRGPAFTFSYGLLHVEDCFLPFFSTASARRILQRVLFFCNWLVVFAYYGLFPPGLGFCLLAHDIKKWASTSVKLQSLLTVA